MNKISEKLRRHYSEKFKKYGATSEGVDWGVTSKAEMRYRAMMGLILSEDQEASNNFSLLDVGCGYGGQLEYMKRNNLSNVKFTGIDIVPQMISSAKNDYSASNFMIGDFLEMDLEEKYDYVTCNGILTQKLSASKDEMINYMERLIEKMFNRCNKGIAFNTMTTHVDYELDGNFHNDPSELLRTLFQYTNKIRLDHSYPLYEYTVYLYK
jgi:2-polyprenyl-3-methyl-5-hydroxy-6-metoxy-1,4-benzoquinol methylase